MQFAVFKSIGLDFLITLSTVELIESFILLKCISVKYEL